VAVISTNDYSYGIACIRCNERLIAPKWSEYVSEHHVRHSWFCESCGHQLETLTAVRGSTSTKARRKNPTFPLLVA
jgi:primosomal protein N'